MDPEQYDGQCPSIFRSLFRLSKTRIVSRYFDSKSKGLFVVVFFFSFYFEPTFFLPLQFLVDLVICSRSCNYKSLMNFVLRYVLNYSNSVLSLVYFMVKATNN